MAQGNCLVLNCTAPHSTVRENCTALARAVITAPGTIDMYLAAHCAPQDGGYVTAHCIASHYVRSLGLTGEQGQLIAQITSALEAHEFFRSGSWCPDGATDESLHRLEASRLRLMLPGLGRDEACRPPLGRCWTCGSAQFKYGAGFAGYRHAGHKRCASHCMCRTGGLSFVRKLT